MCSAALTAKAGPSSVGVPMKMYIASQVKETLSQVVLHREAQVQNLKTNISAVSVSKRWCNGPQQRLRLSHAMVDHEL